MHRRHRRRPPVRWLQHERHRLQGRRPRLPAAVPAGQERGGEDRVAGANARRTVEPSEVFSVGSRGLAQAFSRYVGIDYSGAATPTSSLNGLRVYTADRASLPVEIKPPPSPRKYWTRKGVAE